MESVKRRIILKPKSNAAKIKLKLVSYAGKLGLNKLALRLAISAKNDCDVRIV